jgi:hypothetical protein
MEVSDCPHTSALLPPEKIPVPIEEEAGWTSEPILILPEKRNVLGGQNVIYGFNVH